MAGRLIDIVQMATDLHDPARRRTLFNPLSFYAGDNEASRSCTQRQLFYCWVRCGRLMNLQQHRRGDPCPTLSASAGHPSPPDPASTSATASSITVPLTRNVEVHGKGKMKDTVVPA